MKKSLFIIIFTLSSIAGVSAQDIFKKGDRVINAGIGFGNTYHSGSGYSTKIPAISASFEMCLIDNLFDDKSSLGVGGFVGYSSAEYKYNYAGAGIYKYKYSDFVLGVRGALHYQFVEKLDTYAGLSLGYDIVSGKASGTYMNGDYSASASGLELGLFLGARYYLSDQWAAMLELGYDIAVAKIGVAYKF